MTAYNDESPRLRCRLGLHKTEVVHRGSLASPRFEHVCRYCGARFELTFWRLRRIAT